MPLDAVTFDFHNTIAICDDWFHLEIRDLVPELLHWYHEQPGNPPLAYQEEQVREVYRTLRQDIIQHGREQDATACALHVFETLQINMPEPVVREGIDTLMHATLAASTPVAGVVDGIKALATAGVRLAVISNAIYHPFLEWSLTKFGVRDCFELVVTSASAGLYKSRPELYMQTLARLGAAPGKSVHVGDSCRFDVHGAQAAGMHTVFYATQARQQACFDAELQVTSLVGIAERILDRFGGTPA